MGTTEGKEQFLNRVAQALGRETPKMDVIKPDWRLGPVHDYNCRLSERERIDVFAESCKIRGTRLAVCEKEKLADCLGGILHDYGLGKILFPEGPEMNRFGLEELLENPTYSFSTWNTQDSREDNIRNAEDANIGITFPVGAVADTGMVIQMMDAKQSRSLGLLPQVHISIISEQALYCTLTDAFAALPQETEDQPSQMIFIAGPSSTGDIENNIVIGVHGPMYECVVVVRDE